jgi:hypothetical protein
MNDKEWLSQMKVGDKFVTGEHIGSKYFVHTIKKITDKQFVDKDDNRYWRANGKSLSGDEWFHSYMMPITPEVEAQLGRQKVRRLIENLKLSELNYDQIKKLCLVLEEVAKHE